MRKKSFLLSFVLVMSLFGLVSDVRAEHMTEFPTMECEDPKTTRTIQVVDGMLKYDGEQIQVPKNTCFRMIFHNPDATEHDFTVHYQGEEWIHIDSNSDTNDELGTNTANDASNGELQGNGWATHFYMSPNEDVTLNFYCEVPGHNTTMIGDFVIGNGSSTSAPGFEAMSLLVGFTVLLLIVTVFRKKNRN